MTVTIYHNPRCTKSRLTLTLLKDRGLKPEVIEYLQMPPKAKELEEILSMLGIGPRDLMRKDEAVYKEYDLDNPKKSYGELLNALVRNPILLERPIVIANGKAAIGRPPENVLAIL